MRIRICRKKNDLKDSLLRWDLRGDPEYPPVRISFSGAILYCEATNLWTAFSSSKKIFIRMNGSRPFCVNMCQGLGRASKSETDPCESPRTDSPNRRWLIEYWLSCSFTYWTIIDKLIQGSEGTVKKFWARKDRNIYSILPSIRKESFVLRSIQIGRMAGVNVNTPFDRRERDNRLFNSVRPHRDVGLHFQSN